MFTLTTQEHEKRHSLALRGLDWRTICIPFVFFRQQVFFYFERFPLFDQHYKHREDYKQRVDNKHRVVTKEYHDRGESTAEIQLH